MVAVAAVLSACGSSPSVTKPPPGSDPFVEGTRLKVRWVQAPGAPRVFAGWFDQQLGENCSFEESYVQVGLLHPAGSVQYCRPAFTSATGDLFADPACAEPVASVPCGDVHYVELPPADSSDCAAVSRLFAVADPVTPGTIYARRSGVCAPLAADDPEAQTSLHRLAAEVGVNALVSAQVQNESGSASVVRSWLVASDGSRQVVGAWDTRRQERVFPPGWQPSVASGAAGKWEPVQVAERLGTARVFSDADCTMAAATVSACGDVTVRSAFQRRQGACGLEASYYEAGGILGAGMAFVVDGSTTACRPATGSDLPVDGQVMAVGDEIPASSFADVQAFEQGTGQVRVRTPGSDADAIGAGQQVLFDTAHAAVCEGFLAADGVLRCLPSIITASAYADAACSMPVLVISPTACDPTPAAPSVVGLQEQISLNACGPQYKVHELAVGADHSRTEVYYVDAAGNCRLTPPGVFQGSDVFDLGPEVAPDAFAELTTSTPP